MKNFNSKLLLFLFILPLTYLQGQTKISYAYDAAGNRIERTIVLKSNNRLKQKGKASTNFFEENIDGKQIKLYPNPVKEELTVEINGYKEELEAELLLFNLHGTNIARQKISSYKTQINMRNCSPGTYLMHIIINGEQSVWKVIKE